MSDVVQVSVSREELLKAIRHDCYSFLGFYIGESLTLDVPQFHVEIWEEFLSIVEAVSQPDFLIGHIQKLFAVPREHSKSTLSKLAVILFMRYSPLSFTLYASKTSPIAIAAIRDIMTWFQCEQECELYGAPAIHKSSETDGLWILTIGVPGESASEPMRRKRIILRSVGQGHQVRGNLVENRRPDLIIMDDIEDYDTASSEIQQAKLDEWAMGALMKSAAARSVRIMLGNMVRNTTLLARLSKDPDWNPTVFGCIVKDKESGKLRALWEGRWSVERLLADYRSYRRIGTGHVWETEMMNLSADLLGTQSLDNAIMVGAVHPEEVVAGFICLDPAFGQKGWNDESALTVHVRRGVPGMEASGIPILVDSRVGRWTESQILDNLLELSYYWNLSTWCIESVAAQKLLIPLFRLMLQERQLNPDVFAMLPVTAGKEAKASRIYGFVKAVASRSYALAESQVEVKLKLEEYSPESQEHDDLCDSAAYGLIVWNLYGTTIEARGITNIVGLLMQNGGTVTLNQGENDVCGF